MFSSLEAWLGAGPTTPAFWMAIAGALAAALFAAWTRRAAGRADRAASAAQRLRIELATVQARADEADRLHDALEAARQAIAALERDNAAGQARLGERERALEEMRARLDAEFRSTTATLLDGARKAFLESADETFARHREKEEADGALRRRAIDEMIRPMNEQLARYEKSLGEMREEHQRARGALQNQIGELARSTGDVRAEAQKLTTALRAGPKTRGRWGEEQLRNVVEIAGMSAYVDFVEQKATNEGGARKQPDMVVRLPGGREVVIDSKVSLNNYLDAVEAETDEARAVSLSKHADDLWAHVKALSAKDYAGGRRDALDFVIMFLPGEHLFSAAVEARPDLYHDALNRKVFIATPMLLIAYLKSAALNWRQEKMNENAARIAGMASELYDSIRTMTDHVGRLGKSIEQTVRHYNASVGSLEGRVLSRARRFNELELPGAEADLPEIRAIENAPRRIERRGAPMDEPAGAPAGEPMDEEARSAPSDGAPCDDDETTEAA